MSNSKATDGSTRPRDDKDANAFAIYEDLYERPKPREIEVVSEAAIKNETIFMEDRAAGGDRPASVNMTQPLQATADGVDVALRRLGIELRYNKRSSRPEWRYRKKRKATAWRQVTDRDEGHIRERIARSSSLSPKDRNKAPAPFDLSDARWKRLKLALLYLRGADPFLEWLEALPTHKAEGNHPPVRQWLHKLFASEAGTETGKLVEWAALYSFLGAITRAYWPGAKLDEIPILIGEQGIGKSGSLAWLFPEAHRDDWFSDDFHLDDDAKRQVEALQGPVIVELAEMVGLRRADVEKLKAFISRRTDRVRLTYRPDSEALPRRCVIVGSTNEEEVLPNDPSGNRRFVPILAPSKGDWRTFMDAHREAFWIEALALYRKGREARLPEELHARQAELAEDHRSRDSHVEDLIAERWREIAHKPVTGEGVMSIIGRPHGVTPRVLGRALTHAGFRVTQTRKDGRRLRQWVMPDYQPPETTEDSDHFSVDDGRAEI